MSYDHTYRTHTFDPDDVDSSPTCDECDEPFEDGDEVFVSVDETPLTGGDRAAKCRTCHHWEEFGVAPR